MKPHKSNLPVAPLQFFISHLFTMWRPAAIFITRFTRPIFLVPLAAALLFATGALAQRTDTVASLTYPNKQSWVYKMETAPERWLRSGQQKAFQVFVKYTQAEPPAANTPRANIGFYGKGTLHWLNNVSRLELAGAGVTPQNADSFIYHITLNDSVELVPWTKPKEFRTTNGLTYAYLGQYDVAGKLLRFEMYKQGQYADRNTMVFNSLYLPPAQLQNVVVNHTNQYLFRPHQQHYIPHAKQFHFTKEQWEKDRVRFSWSDSINHLAVQMEPTIQNDLYNVYLKRTIDGKTDTAYVSNAWEQSYYSNAPLLRISSSYFNRPGRYEILVVPELPSDFRRNTMSKAVVVPFTVLASETTMFSLQQVLLWLGLLLLAGSLLFAFFNRRHQRKLAFAAQQQDITRLELTSVRAQLNPHFMFNALAGIQNLINKNEIAAANSYLSRFARITRGVLDAHKTDRVSIAEELKLLHDYLQMEQLRFGFQYTIEADEALDTVNTELPAMLLQPFVENAVKHGVAPLSVAGRITVKMWQQQQTLVMEVRDNGRGFDPVQPSSGLGMELSQKRIRLFNSMNRATPIHLQVQADTGGTQITLTLENWL